MIHLILKGPQSSQAAWGRELAVPGSRLTTLQAVVCLFLGADKFPKTFSTRKERSAVEERNQTPKMKPS